MRVVCTVVFAVLAAVSNASAVVLQRTAARDMPRADAFRFRLMLDLVRRPVWLGGIAAVVCAAVCQALALALGSLALVQPIVVTELAFALVIACVAFRRRLPGYGWAAIAAVTIGIAGALAAAAPSGRRVHVGPERWVAALVVTGGVTALCVLAALARPRGRARAALFGTAAAIGYAVTAALMKSAVGVFHRDGAGAFFTCWQTYAFGATGGTALFLLSNALESGPLLASQPALVLGDALVSLALGILVYEEEIRTGWWLVPEVLGLLLVVAGTLVLPRVEPQALGPRTG
ncbi:DMT family transporter [Streptomyces sp. NPDC002537]